MTVEAAVNVSLRRSTIHVAIKDRDRTATAELDQQAAHRLAADIIDRAAELEGIDPVEADWSIVSVQYLELWAQAEDSDPTEVDEDHRVLIQCWIRGQTRKNAIYVACGWISEASLEVTEIVEQHPVTRQSYAADDPDLAYYEQCLTDGEVFVHHEN